MAKSRKRSEQGTSTTPTSAGAQTLEDTPETEPTPHTNLSSRRVERDADDWRRRVEQRAYELYLSRGGAHGSDWEDWLAAEREVIANRAGDEPPKP